MYNDIVNLWSEDTDLNVVKTWLVGGTDGQTYSITDRFLPRIKIDEEVYEYDYCDIEGAVDEIIGYKHDYKLDDPELEVRAKEIVDGMVKLVESINAHPENYFSFTQKELISREEYVCEICVHRDACRHNKPDFCDSDPACQMFDLN